MGAGDWLLLLGVIAVLLAGLGALAWVAVDLVRANGLARYQRELTPREEAVRQQAVRDFVEGRSFAREDSVLYLNDLWAVQKVSPNGTLLHLRHADGREALVEARLARRLTFGVPAKTA